MSLLPLASIDDPRTFGGKAAQLGAALRAELPVPPGFALSVELVERLLAPDRDASAHAALAEAFNALAGPCAVRSSGVGEDGAEASFAGQHATVLNVRTLPALLAAIATVRDSGRGSGAIAYRKRIGIDEAPRVAVVVQRLIAAEAAGVLFTRNPISGENERLIEASWGLGEAVVAGLVTPDRYRMDTAGRVLERAVGHKDLAIALAEEDGTVEREVAEVDARRLCLDDRQLAALHHLAGRCELLFGSGQDLEFAFAEGELYLLQRRPITTGTTGKAQSPAGSSPRNS